MAFTVLQYLLPDHPKKGVKILIFACAAYLLVAQCRELNYRINIDDLRWQEERALITSIGEKYQEEFDTGKPLVFTGRNRLSSVIMDANYLHKDSVTMRLIARFLPENGMNARQRYCYCILPTASYPVVSWALDTGDHIIDALFKYCGYDVTSGAPDMFAEAAPLRDTMPVWPQPGSMVDAGDYILVNLGEQFLGGY